MDVASEAVTSLSCIQSCVVCCCCCCWTRSSSRTVDRSSAEAKRFGYSLERYFRINGMRFQHQRLQLSLLAVCSQRGGARLGCCFRKDCASVLLSERRLSSVKKPSFSSIRSRIFCRCCWRACSRVRHRFVLGSVLRAVVDSCPWLDLMSKACFVLL